jgi:flavin-dependent dehydrogenase
MTANGLWDVVVIGAGPSGALAACLLARRGMRVALLERATLPRTKVCGGCLNARGVGELESAGLGHVLGESMAVPLKSIEFHRGNLNVPLRGAFGVAVDRGVFDSTLVAAARNAGAVIFEGAHARVSPDVNSEWREVELTIEGIHRESLRGRVVIAADGLGHPSLVGLPTFPSAVAANSRLGLGVLTSLFPRIDCDYLAGQLHMAIGGDGYAGVTRLSDGRLCIAAAIDPLAARRAPHLGAWIARTLAACGLPFVPGLDLAEVRGTPLLTRQSPRVAGRRLLLVGDSAGYTEPITGEGMAWALAGAAALPPIVAAGCRQWSTATERSWERALAANVFQHRNVNRWLAAALKRPALSRVLFSAASFWPAAASAVARKLNQPVQHLRRVA